MGPGNRLLEQECNGDGRHKTQNPRVEGQVQNYLTEIRRKGVEWIKLAQDRIRQCTSVNIETKLPASQHQQVTSLKWRKATLSFDMSVSPSLRQHGATRLPLHGLS